MADHRWPMRPSQIDAAANTLSEAIRNPSAAQAWAKAAAEDLLASKGKCLVLAGVNSATFRSRHRSRHQRGIGKYRQQRHLFGAGGRRSRRRSGRSDAAMEHADVDTLIILGGKPMLYRTRRSAVRCRA